MSESQSQPEFFVDENLGRHDVPNALRGAGWKIRTHHEVYGARDDRVPDAEWLELCGAEGLVVLTKDKRIRYRPAEIAAIRRFKVKAFALTSGNLTSEGQVARLLKNADRINLACASTGPFVYTVHATRIMRIYPA